MGWSSLHNLQTQCKMKMWALARAGEIIIPFPWPITPDLVDRQMLRDCKLCAMARTGPPTSNLLPVTPSNQPLLPPPPPFSPPPHHGSLVLLVQVWMYGCCHVPAQTSIPPIFNSRSGPFGAKFNCSNEASPLPDQPVQRMVVGTGLE